MSTRIHIIALAICLFTTVCAYAKPDKGDKAYVDQEVKILIERFGKDEQRIRNLEKRESDNNTAQNERIIELEKKVDVLSKQLAALKKWAEGKWETGVVELEKAKEPRVPLWVKILLFAVAAIILAVLGLAVWSSRAVTPSNPAESSDRPKCPRCGWEHDPKDTVCKNPNCKTQF